MDITHHYAQKAADALTAFPNSKEKSTLLGVLLFSVDREFKRKKSF